MVAIAADDADATASLQRKLPAIAVVRDPDLVTTSAWGLRIGDAESPYPGTFVVGPDGAVRWRRIGGPAGDWPTYAELDAQLPR